MNDLEHINALYRAWQDAAETCSPQAGYTRDLVARTISVAICRTGRLALLGPTQQVYLP